MSLVGWWQLEGDAANEVGDYPSYEVGGPAYSSGKLGDAYDNTANNGTGIELIRHDPFVEYEAYYSWSLWFKSTTTSGDSVERIISRDASEYPTVTIDQNQASPQDLYFYRGTNSNHAVSVNEWHHLVITIDRGANESQWFIDGDLIGTGGVDSSTLARPFVLGGNTEGDGDVSGNHFIGKIDDVRLYDHVLSEKEVKQLSRAKVLHYKLDTDGSVTDASGQGNDGTINGPTFTQDSMIGSGAYDFVGSNQEYIRTSKNVPSGDPEVTLSVWAKANSVPQTDWTGILSLGTNQSTNTTFTITGDNNGDAVELHTWGNSTPSISLDTNWHHYVAVNTGNGEQRFYADGELIGSMNQSLSLPDEQGAVGTRVYAIEDNNNQMWDGQIDDARIYTTELSDAEIQELYETRASIDAGGTTHSQELADTTSGPAPSNLIGWWPLDGNTDDYAGDNNGTNNGATVTSGLGQEAYDFERDNTEYINVGTLGSEFEVGSGDFTFSTYCNFESTGQYRTLFELSKYSEGILIRPDGDTLDIYIDGDSWRPTIGYNTGQWYHIVITRRSGTVELYVDTVSQGTNTLSGSISISQDSYIGMSVHSTGQNFDGKIQDMRFYDRALTESEIDSIYQQTDTPLPEPHKLDSGYSIETTGALQARPNEIGPAPESLVGWWPLDGNTRDYSENGNDGTNNGATVTSGLGQSSYSFNGSGDYINTSNFPSFDSVTVTAWLYPTTIDGDNRQWFTPSGDVVRSYIKDTGEVNWRVEGGTIDTVDSSPLSTNSWVFLAHTYDNNDGVMKVYIDGTEDVSNSASGSGFSASHLDIGGDPGASGDWYEGKIQDLRVYDRSLTEAEVEQLYLLTDPRTDQQMMQTQDGRALAKEGFNELT